MSPAILTAFPELALSVRQPWAWAIMVAGKDIENRAWQASNPGLKKRGRIALHAAKAMTRDEYGLAADFMEAIGITCPPQADLARGGIIGSVEIVAVAHQSASPWFFGPVGLVLREPRPCAFRPAKGQLGFFRWEPAPIAAPRPQGDLFAEAR